MQNCSTSVSNRELDARCAEILECNVTHWKDPAIGDMLPECSCSDGKHHGLFGKQLLYYSTSLDAARELLEWGLNEDDDDFVTELMLQFPRPPELIRQGIIYSLYLTPRQICEAFVETFGGKDEKTMGD